MMNRIGVYYHDVLVGKLSHSSLNNKVLFQYDSNWIKNGFSISPLSLPLNNEVFEPQNDLFEGLFGVFSDSLPDAWGRLLFEKYIKEKNLQVESVIDKLSFIGKTGMGALEYIPSREDAQSDMLDLDLDQIQKDCSLLLQSKEIKDLENLYRLGSSLGGARPKILIRYKEKDMLVKFISRYDSPSIADDEYKYMTLAKKCGISIPFVALLKGANGHYFAIERFDRKNNEKIHMISAAALLECDFRAPCLDYTDLIKLTKIITHNDDDKLEMFRRMVFNVVFGNQDDHAKNFSYLYDEKAKTYRLSPAYDLTPSKTYFAEHTTSVNGKGKDITGEDMLAVAKKCYIPLDKAKEIIDQVNKIYKKSF